MYRYVVSYELGKDAGHQQREARFISELKQASTELPWFEGDSLAFVHTWLPVVDFADWVYFGSGLDPKRDRFLVIDAGESSAVAIGPFQSLNRLSNHFRKCLIKFPDPLGSDTCGRPLLQSESGTSGQRAKSPAPVAESTRAQARQQQPGSNESSGERQWMFTHPKSNHPTETVT